MGVMIHELPNGQNQQEDTKSVQEVSSGFSAPGRGKSHADYWLKKIFRPKYNTDVGPRETGSYSVKIQHARRRELFPLNTSNRAEAAKTAKQIWASLVANGWEKTLTQFKPNSVHVPPIFVTVGDYLDYLTANRLYTPQALYRNTTKLFTALGSMFETDKPRTRFDARRVGLKKWHDKLRAIKLSDLTPMRVELWKSNYLALRCDNPIQEIRAKHTIDSYIRAAKAVFGQKIRKRLNTFGITLASPVPFADTTFVTRGRSSFRYRSRIDPVLLTSLAIAELPTELLKIFLLALHAGLRRNEIDKLTWQQFDFLRQLVRIEVTKYAELKTEGSEDDVGLEPELSEFFKNLSKTATGIFVIESNCAPRKTGGWRHYRAQKLFTALCRWLRSKGVDVNRPIHTLRKEFGKLIAEKMGIFAASLALRHSSVSVTEIFYAHDARLKVTGLGGLIKSRAEAYERL